MSKSITRSRKIKITLGGVLLSGVALLATGFLFAAGYDIYARLFKKPTA